MITVTAPGGVKVLGGDLAVIAAGAPAVAAANTPTGVPAPAAAGVADKVEAAGGPAAAAVATHAAGGEDVRVRSGQTIGGSSGNCAGEVPPIVLRSDGVHLQQAGTMAHARADHIAADVATPTSPCARVGAHPPRQHASGAVRVPQGRRHMHYQCRILPRSSSQWYQQRRQ